MILFWSQSPEIQWTFNFASAELSTTGIRLACFCSLLFDPDWPSIPTGLELVCDEKGGHLLAANNVLQIKFRPVSNVVATYFREGEAF